MDPHLPAGADTRRLIQTSLRPAASRGRVFTDIVGSTDRQSALGDRAWKDLIQRHHAVVRGALKEWRGTEVDTAGDGFFATFDGPARAIRCALEVGQLVRELGIEIRAGVHTGECELIDGKASGIAVREPGSPHSRVRRRC